MKKLLSVAAVALLSTAGVAQAQSLVVQPLPSPSTSSYDQSHKAVANAGTANETETNKWVLSGEVTKDCSFYAGASGAQSNNLSLGTIGVQTGSDQGLTNAFKMVGAQTAKVNSSVAGCNFNNSVTIRKSAQGLVNVNPGLFDNAQFQANIPYSVAVSIDAGANSKAPAGPVTASTTASVATQDYGAWKSAVAIAIEAPIAAKALVAGTYSDTLTVELAAK